MGVGTRFIAAGSDLFLRDRKFLSHKTLCLRCAPRGFLLFRTEKSDILYIRKEEGFFLRISLQKRKR